MPLDPGLENLSIGLRRNPIPRIDHANPMSSRHTPRVPTLTIMAVSARSNKPGILGFGLDNIHLHKGDVVQIRERGNATTINKHQ